MKKLSLNMDQLCVETFTTDAAMEERGTVEGNSLPTYPLCSAGGGTNCKSYNCNTATCTLEVCC